MARKSKWGEVKKLLPDLVEALSQGELIKDICQSKDNKQSLLPITMGTYYMWLDPKQSRFKKELFEAVTRARELVVENAKQGLTHNAVKHTLTDEITEIWTDSSGKTKKHKRISKREVDPDTKALQFILVNKSDGEYKNQTNTEVSGSLDTKQDTLAGLPKETVAKIAKQALEDMANEQ